MLHHDTTGLPSDPPRPPAGPRPVYRVDAAAPAASAAEEIVAGLRRHWERLPAALILAADSVYSRLVEQLRARLAGMEAQAGDGAPGESVRAALHGGDTLVCGGYFLAAGTGPGRFAPALFVNLGPGSRLLAEPLVVGPLLGVARSADPGAADGFLRALHGAFTLRPLRCAPPPGPPT